MHCNSRRRSPGLPLGEGRRCFGDGGPRGTSKVLMSFYFLNTGWVLRRGHMCITRIILCVQHEMMSNMNKRNTTCSSDSEILENGGTFWNSWQVWLEQIKVNPIYQVHYECSVLVTDWTCLRDGDGQMKSWGLDWKRKYNVSCPELRDTGRGPCSSSRVLWSVWSHAKVSKSIKGKMGRGN